MTTHDTQDSAAHTVTDSDLLGRLYQPWRKEALEEFPFKLIFVAFAVAAPIMLVGLPSAALAIVHLSDCCTNQSLTSFLTFWGSLFAGMVALFGTLIAAVFVISAFRIDKSARVEARVAAEVVVGDFILKHGRELLKKVDDWANKVESRKDKTIEGIDAAAKKVESRKDEVIRTIDAAQTAVGSRKDEAIGSIGAAKAAVESASEDAVAGVAAVRDNVARSGEQAMATIDQAVSDVQGRTVAAVERVDAEVAEFERTVAEARAKTQTQPDDSPPSDSRE